MPTIRRFLDTLLVLAFGSRCPGCGERSLRAPCIDCLRVLARAPQSEWGIFVDVGPARRLIRAAKLGRWRRGGRWFADAAILTHMTVLPYVDAVAWVPADRGRRARRGVHLPEAIARRIARHYAIPVAPLLRRHRGAAMQRGKSRAERLDNAVLSFTVDERAAWPPGARVVLLIDDVRTTGATLEACADLLRRVAPPDAVVLELAMTSVEEQSELRSERGFHAHEAPDRCR